VGQRPARPLPVLERLLVGPLPQHQSPLPQQHQLPPQQYQQPPVQRLRLVPRQCLRQRLRPRP
jgi:hypothetical protein